MTDQPSPTPPGPKPMSAKLDPSAIALTLTLGATDGQRNDSQQSLVQVTLVNGRLPAEQFAAQRAAISATIAAWPIDEQKKAALTQGAVDALAKLQLDIDASLDALPRHMAITRTDAQLGARFDFKHAAGDVFVANGLYNVDSTEFFLGALTFANGTGTEQFALLGLAAATFGGHLTPSDAQLHFAAAGLLGVANVGVVSVQIDLQTTFRLTRD